MEYPTTYNKVQRIVAEFNFEFARCHDVIRLNQLLKNLRKNLVDQQKDTNDMVKELEDAPHN